MENENNGDSENLEEWRIEMLNKLEKIGEGADPQFDEDLENIINNNNSWKMKVKIFFINAKMKAYSKSIDGQLEEIVMEINDLMESLSYLVGKLKKEDARYIMRMEMSKIDNLFGEEERYINDKLIRSFFNRISSIQQKIRRIRKYYIHIKVFRREPSYIFAKQFYIIKAISKYDDRVKRTVEMSGVRGQVDRMIENTIEKSIKSMLKNFSKFERYITKDELKMGLENIEDISKNSIEIMEYLNTKYDLKRKFDYL